MVISPTVFRHNAFSTEITGKNFMYILHLTLKTDRTTSWNLIRSATAVSRCRSAVVCPPPPSSRQDHDSSSSLRTCLSNQCHTVGGAAHRRHQSASPNHSLCSSASSFGRNTILGCYGSAEARWTSEAARAVNVCVFCRCTKVFLAAALSGCTKHRYL